MNVARSAAEAAVALERFLGIKRRRLRSTNGAAPEPNNLCNVYREKAPWGSSKPGYGGPFLFLSRVGANAHVLMEWPARFPR